MSLMLAGKIGANIDKIVPWLTRYTQNGQVEIDNNLIENSIRPVALGRKNYLFVGSHEAARQAAMIYSFLGTCKINNVGKIGDIDHPFPFFRDHASPAGKDHSKVNIHF
jgi:hypothetical protein